MGYRSGENFTLLVVCTGNVCRSPAIERLFRAAFGARSGVKVRSAGTGALVGEPIQPPMAKLLAAREVDASDFAARQLTEDHLVGADLVLTATREHRATVVEAAPAVLRRTFTVREFARLAEQVDPEVIEASAVAPVGPAERLAALVPLAGSRRAMVDVELDDIIDPFRQSDEVYAESFDQLLQAVRTIAQIALGVRG